LLYCYTSGANLTFGARPQAGNFAGMLGFGGYHPYDFNY
jgi:hypothetical protein